MASPEPKPACSEPEVCALPKPTGPVALTDDLAVGPAPAREDLARLAAAGFRSIINNRPDTDEALRVTAADMAAEAELLGLGYRHIPVEGRNPLEKDVRSFARALAELPKPVFAYCASGGRSSALWAMAAVGGHDTETLIGRCRDIGFDVSGLSAKMDMRREMLKDQDDD